MKTGQSNAKQIAISVGEILLGLVCLYLFWGGKHFIMSDPNTSYEKVTAYVTGTIKKNRLGTIGGGEMQMGDYITFEAVDENDEVICSGEAQVSNYLSKKLEVDEEIEGLVGDGLCLSSIDEQWNGTRQGQLWFQLVLSIGFLGHAAFSLRKLS
jgi:hypothetical protein